MKTNPPLFWLALTVLGLVRTEALGEEVAMVKDSKVNVRGQPSLAGEVITQLQKDEKVIVLEEISVEKAKKGEPAKWARIQMPANTPVWVFASYIDPNNKTVAVSRMNLRAGPGENFSVVGRLERGDTVKEIRKVQDWMEIETPDKAYGFVAAEFLSKIETHAAPLAAKSEKTGASPEPTKIVPDRTPPAEARQPENVPSPARDASAVGIAPSPKAESLQPAPPLLPGTPAAPTETPYVVREVAPSKLEPAPSAPAQNVAPAALPVILPAETVPPPPTESGPPPRRIVRREGVVRSTKSIQAPTYVELASPDTRKVINYLHTTDPELKLKDFRGKKIVVTGEEGIDSRWPNTPILEVETIELAP